MANDGRSIVLILFQEVIRTRKGYLVDVFVNLLGCHSNATVRNRKSPFRLINADANRQIAHFTLEVALHGQSLELLGCVYGIAHNLAEKNLMVAIKKFLDNRENVLGSDSDITFLHNLNR